MPTQPWCPLQRQSEYLARLVRKSGDCCQCGVIESLQKSQWRKSAPARKTTAEAARYSEEPTTGFGMRCWRRCWRRCWYTTPSTVILMDKQLANTWCCSDLEWRTGYTMYINNKMIVSMMCNFKCGVGPLSLTCFCLRKRFFRSKDFAAGSRTRHHGVNVIFLWTYSYMCWALKAYEMNMNMTQKSTLSESTSYVEFYN